MTFFFLAASRATPQDQNIRKDFAREQDLSYSIPGFSVSPEQKQDMLEHCGLGATIAKKDSYCKQSRQNIKYKYHRFLNACNLVRDESHQLTDLW